VQSDDNNVYKDITLHILRDILRERGMTVGGKKWELVRRLWKDDNAKLGDGDEQDQENNIVVDDDFEDIKMNHDVTLIVSNTKDVKILADSFTAESVVIGRCDFDEKNFIRLMVILSYHPRVHTVDICHQSYDVMKYVARLIKTNPRIATLKLRHTDDSKDDLRPLSDVLINNTSLKTLEIIGYDASKLRNLAGSLSLNRGLVRFAFYQHPTICPDYSDIETLLISARLNIGLKQLALKSWLHISHEGLADHVCKIGRILEDHPALQQIELGMDIPNTPLCLQALDNLRHMLTRNCS